MDLGLTGKVAVITGSSKGLGRAAAWSLAHEGCAVVICARGTDALHATASAIGESIGHPERVLAVEADLTTDAGITAVMSGAVERFGGIDILVNNLGLGKGAGLLDTPDETWQEAIDVTLFPAIRASRAAVQSMRRRSGGVIVLVTSIWGRESGGRMVYNAVKAAENSLAKSLAQQLAHDNIRVNAVAPGSILFEGGSWWKRRQEDPDAISAFVARELPFGRFGRADEVGDVIAFLCSPRASWISGACLPVDGCQSRSNL